MNQDDELDEIVRELTMEIMLVLYKHGYQQVHVGGMMRLLGVSDEHAAEHDEERISLNEKFAEYLNQLDQFEHAKPDSTYLH